MRSEQRETRASATAPRATSMAMFSRRKPWTIDGSDGKAPAAAPLAQGQETVLVVEDEAAVRALICEILQGSGYTVVPAGSPLEALALCERHAGPIQLTLTDVVMPQMGGRELAARIALLRSDSNLGVVHG